MALGREELAQLEAFRSDVRAEVNDVKSAAVRECEAVVAPFRPVVTDVAKLKAETAKQTPILEKLAKESKRAAVERRNRKIIDEQKRLEAAKWKKRYRVGVAALGAIAGLAEIYRAFHG